jgi:hypothetical protein
MQFSLLIFALFSTTVFAIGLPDMKDLQSSDSFLTGATSIDDTNKKFSHVTEVSGTFQ